MDNFLRRRNYVNKVSYYQKGFVNVTINHFKSGGIKNVEVSHDCNNTKTHVITEGFISKLPLVLNYFETI